MLAIATTVVALVAAACHPAPSGPWSERVADLVYPASPTLPGSTSHYRRVNFANERRVVLPGGGDAGADGWRRHAAVDVDVPAGARLELAWGAPRGSAGDLGMRVRVESAGGSRVLLERRLASAQTGHWIEETVESFPAGRQRVVFESRSSPSALVEIASARLFRPHTRLATPNVVLISMDTLRAQELPLYGSALPTAPKLERRFGRGGLVFEHVITPATQTFDGHVAMLTGTDPCASKHDEPGKTHILPGVRSFAEVLAGAGYRTASFNEDAFLIGGAGFDRGFDSYYQDHRPEEDVSQGHIEDTFDKGIAWIGDHRDESFFLFLHTYEVHSPYTPPERYAREFPVAAGASQAEKDLANYRAEIAYADDQLDRVFAAIDAAGLASDTIVVVTADHGEEFGEHGHRYHGPDLVSEVLHVPLLIQGPGIPPGERRSAPMGLQDLAPTLLEMLGLPAPAEMDGVSFAGVIAGRGAAPVREIYADASVPACWTYEGADLAWEPPSIGVTRWPFRLVRSLKGGRGVYRAFDLVTDPGEKTDLYAASPASFAPLREGLDGYFDRCAKRAAARSTNGASAGGSGEVDSETSSPERLRKLRTLGYLQ